MTAAGGPTLREQLGGSSDPDFEIKLAAGWERRTPDEADRQDLLAGLKEQTMGAHRPEIYAKLSGMVKESYEAMQSQGALAFYAPTRVERGAIVPGSMIATICRPPDGGTLDGLVRHAVREYGATPLFGDKRFVRFARERTLDVGDSSIVQTSIVYTTPIPGSGHRRGLQFVASFARPPEVPADDEKVRMYAATFDLMVSTLRWRTPLTAG